MPSSPRSLSELLAQAVEIRPYRLATVDGAMQCTWEQTAERVARLAGGIAAAGVQPGDRVAVLAPNSTPLFELFFAVPRAGAVLVPLNHRLSEPELARILADAAPHLLLVAPDFWDLAQRLRASSAAF